MIDLVSSLRKYEDILVLNKASHFSLCSPNPTLFFSSLLIHHPMESTHTQTTTVWTDEKHLHFLNTMEASFVRRMLHHYAALSSHLLSASTATSPTPLNQPSIPNPFAGPRNIPIHPQVPPCTSFPFSSAFTLTKQIQRNLRYFYIK